MKVVFFGTPHFSVESLQRIKKSKHEVLAVVSQPDKPKGRGLKYLPTPVKTAANELGIIDVYQPENLSEIKEYLESLDAEVFVVVAYGKLLPAWILYMKKYGCINVHPSLLPKYRGAAPIERAILNGDKETGMSIMRLQEGMDDGPVYLQKKILVGENENVGSVKNGLSVLGAEMLVEVLNRLEEDNIIAVEQDHSNATFADKILKEELQINWKMSAEEIHNKIRAFSPKPGAFCMWENKRLKLLESSVVSPTQNEALGTIVKISKESFDVSTGDGIIKILEVQLEGKKPMSVFEFLKGYNLREGERLL